MSASPRIIVRASLSAQHSLTECSHLVVDQKFDRMLHKEAEDGDVAGVRNFHASLPKGTSHIGATSPKVGLNLKTLQVRLECTLELGDVE